MGVLEITALVWKVLQSRLGLYLLAALAVAGALWWVYHEGRVSRQGEIDTLQQQILDLRTAGKQAELAAQEAKRKAQATERELRGKLANFARGRITPTTIKEVARELAPSIDGCAVSNSFVWLRDLPFHPEYARLAREASSVERSGPTGIAPSAVAQADAELIHACQAAFFNLEQWETWYDQNRQAWEILKAKVEVIPARK